MAFHFRAAYACDPSLAKKDFFDYDRAFGRISKHKVDGTVAAQGAQTPASTVSLAALPTGATYSQEESPKRYCESMAKLESSRKELDALRQTSLAVAKVRSTAHEVNLYAAKYGRPLQRLEADVGPMMPIVEKGPHPIDGLQQAALASVLARHAEE